ncbi:MAG: hypothetical protein WAQ24_04785 [Candidatus Saccharimonadales bacterium]
MPRQTGGLVVSPSQLSFTISNESQDISSSITITNQYNREVSLQATLQGIDESSLSLIPKGSLEGGLRDSLTVGEAEMRVPPHGVYQLQVQLRDPSALAPGGHYASLVITEQSNAAMAASAVRPAVAISIFVVKSDGLRTDMRLQAIKTNQGLLGLPSNVKIAFFNGGNAHIVPRASVMVLTKDGTEVAKGIVNDTSRPLFPGKSQDYSATLQRIGSVRLPTQLQVKTLYRIDSSDIQYIHVSSFWYVPPIFVVAVAVLLGAVWFLWRKIGLRKLLSLVSIALKRLRPRRRSASKKIAKPNAKQAKETRTTPVANEASTIMLGRKSLNETVLLADTSTKPEAQNEVVAPVVQSEVEPPSVADTGSSTRIHIAVSEAPEPAPKKRTAATTKKTPAPKATKAKRTIKKTPTTAAKKRATPRSKKKPKQSSDEQAS